MTPNAGGAEYLLRLDDLCPTMDREPWMRVLDMVRRYKLRPILGVIPENFDPEFRACQVDPEFWGRMCALQAEGATVGLHGYQHLCHARGWGLVPLHRETEFAGAPMEHQREWIRRGLEILRGHGLEPRIWVAPRHGSDRNTLRALRECGLMIVSDGFARRPYRAHGVCWIPQQLWSPVEKQQGLWTICVHPATADAGALDRLEMFVASRRDRFTSVERVMAEWPMERRTYRDRLFAWRRLARHHLSRWHRLREA